ncbi:LysR family transcriptional regulator [Variovorax saccharolyticus]|uniref:LysR family transcriptional regulator n=1 Tax=Variovorax saccharolyticus TaxID=3053516 RepID=UPI002576A2CE|nr:LysR family transcriptional regulator [Variovorax sp. J22R187]MDM0021434.1 LysR substrate-binding domain-containing protein [Variovorax sp. J22R187]
MSQARTMENLEVFVDTVRTGSFSAVARRRGVAVSSVARQIDALEEELKASLFTRSTRAMRPTDAGELLFRRAVQILSDLADARSEVSSVEAAVEGVLRVSCLPTFGRRYVVPCLAKLLQAHPGLSVELDLTERLADPTTERLDLAIRFGNLPDSALFSSRLADQAYVVCAAPDYLRRQGPLQALDALDNHRLIDKRRSQSPLGWREVLGEDLLQHGCCVFEADDFDAQRQAAVDGVGIVRLPDWVVGHDIGRGALVALHPQGLPAAEATGIHLVRALPRPSARLKAFAAALTDFVGRPASWQRAMNGEA